MRVILVALLLALGTRVAAADGTPAAEPADLEKVIESLGAPARWSVANALVKSPGAARGETGMTMVAALSRAGGEGAARGLAVLVERGDDRIQIAGLQAIASLGIRTSDAAKVARAALQRGSVAVRAAACDALGRVGGGEDVPGLLGALTEQDADVAPAAYQGLLALSGSRIPYVPALWTWWWQSTATQGRSTLWTALDQVDREKVPVDRARGEDALPTILLWGWNDLPAVADSTRTWLRSSDPRLQVLALRVAAGLRLGDLAGEVRSVLLSTTDSVVWTKGCETAESLGIPMDGLRPPSSVVARRP